MHVVLVPLIQNRENVKVPSLVLALNANVVVIAKNSVVVLQARRKLRSSLVVNQLNHQPSRRVTIAKNWDTLSPIVGLNMGNRALHL